LLPLCLTRKHMFGGATETRRIGG